MRFLLARLVVFALGCGSGLLRAQSPVVYVGDAWQHRITAIAADAAGNTYVTGSRVFPSDAPGISPFPVETTEVFVAKLDANTSERVWIRYFSGKGHDTGTAIGVDSSGNVYAAGTTTSSNFPLVSPMQSEPGLSFILKLSGDGSRVLWSTYFGQPSSAKILSLAVAPDNTVVVGGSKLASTFQNTRGFVAKVDASGSRVIWEREFFGEQLACSGGSSCFLSPRLNDLVGLAIDAAGNVYAAGNTNTRDFPTTAGVLLEKGYGPYVRKFDSAGAVVWSTYVSDQREGTGTVAYPSDVVSAIAVGSQDGSVYLTGGGSAKWRTTPGAYRTTYEGPAGARNVFVAKLNATGTALVWSTFLPHAHLQRSSVVVDAAGDAVVSGGTHEAPGSADFVTQVNAAGTALLQDGVFPQGSRGGPIAIDARGRLHASGGYSGLVSVSGFRPEAPVVHGLANAAGTRLTGRVVAGELISIYGVSLGDTVHFNGKAGVVLYTSPTQINAIVPFSARAGERLTVSVRRAAVETGRAVVAVTEMQPEVFKASTGRAAALNEDGSVNAESNPAKAGSVVAVWGTGISGWPADTLEGSINAASPLRYLSVRTSTGSGDDGSQVLFAGAAPGLPAGVFQVNVRLPAEVYFQPGQRVVSVPIYPIAGLEVGEPAFVYVMH
ncbi:MAG TPA: SBBP repeat-containing protein [Bryobacteraceae bacterium]|nr:SBBP repeat-containing protein [Bryobacteraceae bacterium]